MERGGFKEWFVLGVVDFFVSRLRFFRRGSCCIGGGRCLSRLSLVLFRLFRIVVVRGLRWGLVGGCLAGSCRLDIRIGYRLVRSV